MPCRPAWIIALLISVIATGERLPARTYTTADGLPHNTVTSVLHDRRGYLWFATEEGLARFDGYQFTAYGTSHGLAHPFVSGLVESSGGAIWAATLGGLCRFEPTGSPEHRFVCYRPPGENPRAFRVTVVRPDRDGSFWVGTNAGLYRMTDPPAGKEAAFTAIGLERQGSPRVQVNALAEDTDGSLWIAAAEGLYRRHAGGQVDRFTVANGLPDNFIAVLLADRNGRLWAGTHYAGLCRISHRASVGIRIVERTFGPKDGVTSKRIQGLFQSSDGRVWVCTPDGLLAGTPGRGGEMSFRGFTSAHGLPGSGAESITEDRDHNLWVLGSEGATKLQRNGFVTYTETDGLGDSRVRALFEGRNGRLIAITRQLQVNEFDGERFHMSVPRLPSGNAYPAWGWGWNQTVVQDRDAEWWIPTGIGVFRFAGIDAADLARRSPRATYTSGNGLSGSSHVFRMFEDLRGDVWISTFGTPDGLTLWQRSAGQLIAQTVTTEMKSGPVTAFVEDRAGNLWMGFYTGGLARYRGGRYTLYRAADGAPSVFVGPMLRDRAGRLWIGSRGLLRIDNPEGDQPAFHHYGAPFAGRTVSAITEDAQGRIYVAISSGILRFDPNRFLDAQVFRRYTSADGLPNAGITCALRDHRGVLWFGSHHGLASLVPESDEPESDPAVFITGIRVAGRERVLPDGGEDRVPPVELGHGETSLQIDFVGLGSRPEGGLTFQYRLHGADENWSSPVAERSVHLASLAPGSYRFEVRANSAGRPSVHAAGFAFQVHGPLWRTWWFALIALTAAGTAVWAAHRYRVRRLLEMDRMRMSLATDLHDELGSSLSQIAILSEVAIANADRSATALRRIAELARDVIDSTSEMVWTIRPHRDRVSDLVQRMREIVSDVLVPANVELRFHAPDLVDTTPLAQEVRRQLLFILKEAVSNVAKHSAAHRVDVTLTVAGERLLMQISDDGTGMSEVPSNSRGERHGIAGMRWRAESIGARLNITSKPGQGTTVAIETPLAARGPLRKLAGVWRSVLPYTRK